MSALTDTRTAAGTAEAARRPRLSGLTWLVWRQHRAGYWTILVCAVAAAAVIVYERAQMMDYLNGYGWPHPKSDDWQRNFNNHPLTFAGYALGLVPVLVGVFLGAPLIAADLESGTAKLVTSHSVSRLRWLTVKLGMSALVAVVAVGLLSALFGWWWGPVREEETVLDWTSGTVFDTTGPVPVALTLFTMVTGVAIGMLLRRTLMSMVVTFGFAVALQVAWSYVRLDLGDIVTLTTHHGVMAENSFPTLPTGAYEVDQSYLTASGKLIGWSTCAQEPTEQARKACLDGKGVVGWSVDYLPVSQMSSMQWFGASILLVLTAAVTAFILLRGRKRLV